MYSPTRNQESKAARKIHSKSLIIESCILAKFLFIFDIDVVEALSPFRREKGGRSRGSHRRSVIVVWLSSFSSMMIKATSAFDTNRPNRVIDV